MTKEERKFKEDMIKDFRNVCAGLCCCCVKESTFFSCVPFFLAVFNGIGFVLIVAGIAIDDWITVDNGDNSTLSNTTDDAFKQISTVKGTQFAALSFLILSLMLIIFTLAYTRTCMKKSTCVPQNAHTDSLKRVCFYCVQVLYLISGIAGLAGCIVVASLEYTNGPSLYLCLTASLIQLIIGVILCSLCVIQRKDCLGVQTIYAQSQAPTARNVGSDEIPDTKYET